MSILSMIFFGFLSIVAVKLCVRSAKVGLRGIDSLFDRIEDRFKK